MCTEKRQEDDKYTVKARLVVRSFEENLDDSCTRVDSPTAGKCTLRVFLALVASLQWICYSIDIKSAFLQGDVFQREVFIRPPKEAAVPSNCLWKLNKCVYGLGDASIVWYYSVKAVLLKLGCVQLKTDPAMFYWYRMDKLAGMFLIHVDDFLWSGLEEFSVQVIEKVRGIFKVGKEACETFRYLGLDIKQGTSFITLDQKSYIKSILPIPISHARSSNKNDALNKEETDALRSIIGQLNWVSTQSRPDISYDVLELSNSLKSPKVENLCKANKIIKKLHLSESHIIFPNLGDLMKLKLIVLVMPHMLTFQTDIPVQVAT